MSEDRIISKHPLLYLSGRFYAKEDERFDPTVDYSGVEYVFIVLGSYRQLWDNIPCLLPWILAATKFTYPVFH